MIKSPISKLVAENIHVLITLFG